jgi:hypothetical protein
MPLKFTRRLTVRPEASRFLLTPIAAAHKGLGITGRDGREQVSNAYGGAGTPLLRFTSCDPVSIPEQVSNAYGGAGTPPLRFTSCDPVSFLVIY